MSAPAYLDRRCRRGERCVRRDRHTTTTCGCRCHLGGAFPTCDQPTGCADTHTEATETVTYVGVLLENPAAGFCPSCTGRLTLALDELPKLYTQLSLLHLPSLAIRYQHDTISGGKATGSPALVNQAVDALARQIDYEPDVWAEIVALDAGVDWDSRASAASRPGHRLQVACQLLKYRIVQWLATGEREYRARSLTENPYDGHDPDTTTRYRDDWWCRYDGPAAAGRILDLHHQAVRATGGGPADHIPVPCGYCSSRTLRRDHHTGVVRCRTCGDTKTDDAYDAFLEAALAAYEMAPAAA